MFNLNVIEDKKMMQKLKTMFVKKANNSDYFWVGHGSNPLKEHGIRDMSEYKKV